MAEEGVDLKTFGFLPVDQFARNGACGAFRLQRIDHDRCVNVRPVCADRSLGVFDGHAAVGAGTDIQGEDE